MKEYLIQLRQYITANPIQFDDDCDHPALDSLYWHYSECHNMSNTKTKAVSGNLHDHLIGFTEGVKAGIRLRCEL